MYKPKSWAISIGDIDKLFPSDISDIPDIVEKQQRKNESFEFNYHKELIRKDLVNQFHQARHLCHVYWNNNGNKFVVCTLPGENGFFEQDLMAKWDEWDKSHASDQKLEIYCAEKNKKIYDKVSEKLPSCVKLWNENIDKVIDKQIISKGKLCDVIWHDYCKYISLEDINSIVSKLKNVMNVCGAYYITCNISGGRFKNGIAGVYKKIVGLNPCDELDHNGFEISSKYLNSSILSETIIKQFDKAFKRNKIRHVALIYNVTYQGGSNDRTAMVTLGFSIGLPQCYFQFDLPDPIVSDRIRIAKWHRREYKKQIKKEQNILKKIKKIPNDISKKDQAYKMFEKGFDNESICRELMLPKMTVAGCRANITRIKMKRIIKKYKSLGIDWKSNGTYETWAKLQVKKMVKLNCSKELMDELMQGMLDITEKDLENGHLSVIYAIKNKLK